MREITDIPRKRKLSRQQELMLLELDEPNRNEDGTWYFPWKDGRTLRVLARHGLAEPTEMSQHRIGYRLTKAGKDYVRAMTKTAVQP